MKDDRLYLIHILECVSRIAQYTAGGKDEFFRDSKTQDAVIRNLEILAESSQRISSTLKDEHAEVGWEKIAGFRNVLVHEYLGINLARVWEVVELHVPELKQRVIELPKGLGQSPSEL